MADNISNMLIFTIIGYVAGLFGLIAVVAASVTVVKSASTKATVESQAELIRTLNMGKDEQKEQILDLQAKHIESTKAISGLQGQVNVLRDLPLRKIGSDLKKMVSEMNHISDTQLEIVEILKKNGFHDASK